MSFWKQFPFIRLTFALITGIIAGFAYPCDFEFWLLLPGYASVAFIILILSKRIIYRYRWIPGILIFLFLSSLVWHITSEKYSGSKKTLSAFYGEKKFFIADISEPVIQKAKSTKVVLKILAVFHNGKWINTTGKVLVYIQKSDLSGSLFYGDRILLRSTLTKPRSEMNPGGFNAQKHLSYKGIYSQSYLRTPEWKKLERSSGNPVVSLALMWRNTLLEIFRANGLTGKEFAVASALLLGYVDELDQEIMQDYSITGAMHILSVSGMHVGVIFIFLEKLLSFLNKDRARLIIKAVLIITFIWVYALITGLSPAVLRAATMITLVIIGKSTRRHPHIFNILGVSIFFLLILEPGLLFDLGFLLSYLAVGGIVLLYQPVKALLEPKNRIVEKIWAIIAISIVAQLATLPMCLYVFHQFPNYFLFTNLAIVPLSNFIIYTGIFCLAFGFVPIISGFIAKVLFYLVQIMNEIVHFIASLPFSSTKGIFISYPDTLLLYGFLLFLIMFGFKKNKGYFYLSLVFMVFFSGNLVSKTFVRLSNSAIIVYSNKGEFLADFIDGRRSILAGNLKILEDNFFLQSLQRNHQEMNVINNFITKSNNTVNNPILKFFQTDHLIQFYNKRVGVFDNRLSKHFSDRIKVDFVIVSSNNYFIMSDILKNYDTKVVVLDGSVSVGKIKRLQREADSLGVYCHSLTEKGAFIYKF